MGKLRNILLGISLYSVQTLFAGVKFNEVMPCNISSYMDKGLTFNFSGYVEFYNSDTVSINLQGYKIVHENRTGKDLYEKKWEWTIPDSCVVSKKGYQVIFFDEVKGINHSIYKLDADGGKLYLYNKGGKLVNQFTYPAMKVHVAYGPEGFMEPSPMKKNTLAVKSLSEGRCAQPVFSGAQPGVLTETAKLKITCSTPNAVIRYTTDGTEPTSKSDTFPSSGKEIKSNKVIRVRAYAEGYLPSPIVTGSFLFVDDAHKSCGGGYTVPIVSLVVDNYYLEDDSVGMCVKGVNGAPINISCLGSGKANFMRDWLRPANFEYIVDGQQVLTHEVEIGMMGGCSRSNPVKSFKVKAGKKLGSGNNILKYRFFEDKPDNEYTSVHIRNGGNAYDASAVRCRDGYMQSLARAMNVDYQAYQPVAYFINGKYKGLMGLRERTSDDFVEANHKVDDIDMIKITNQNGVEPTSGDSIAYFEMVNFLETANPTAPNYYDQAAKYIDMNEYIDYLVMEHFIVNTDWPGNNCKLWREKENGRFRWILYDTDFGLGLYPSAPNYCVKQLNSIKWCMGEGDTINWSNGVKVSQNNYKADAEAEWKVTIFKHLMQNEVFKEKFLNRNLIHLGTTFTEGRVQDVWDSLYAVVKDEYCASFHSTNLKDLPAVSSMLSFAKERPQYMYQYLRDYYQLGSLLSLDFSSNVKGVRFMMNDELVNLSSYSGKYFKGKNLKLEAIAPWGYRFVRWEMSDGDVSVDVLNKSTKWKFAYDSIGQKDNSWTKASFNDSLWATGHGKMGYADDTTSYQTVLDYGDDVDHKYMTSYYRTKINLEDTSCIKNIKLSIVYDDGFVLYVNGKEFMRKNIKGEVEYSTPATTYENDAVKDTTITRFSAFKKGKNVIAVEVHQEKATSSDMTFQMSMKVNYKNDVVSGRYKEPILTTTLTQDQKFKAIFEKVEDCPELPLLISEVAPSNNSESDVTDEYGNHPDWFEIYNNGADTINIAGLYLTDNPNKPFKSQIPYGYEDTKLAPGSHFLLWADNKPFRGVHHADFKLNNTKTESALYMYRGCDDSAPIDVATYTPLPQNASMGRADDSSDTWTTFFVDCKDSNASLVYLPSPNAENGKESLSCGESGSVTTDDIDNDKVSCYPNPTVGVVTVSVKETSQIKISLYDGLGRLCGSYSKDSSEMQIDVTSLPAGVYTMQIVSDSGIYRQMLLKR